MLKNFSQPFETHASMTYLLIEDSISGNFLSLESAEDVEEYGEGRACRTLNLNIDEQQDYTSQLVKFLYHNGIVLVSFRELLRETAVSFSFADDTAGSQSSTVCLHVIADIINDKPIGNKDDAAQFIPLTDLSQKLHGGEFGHKIVNASLIHLMLECE